MVFAEAQAVGTPVVSFNHAAIPEVVNNGRTGLAFPEKKSSALAPSLLTLLNNGALWSSMSRQAVEWVNDRFNIRKQTRNLESLYDECVAQRKHAYSDLSQ